MFHPDELTHIDEECSTFVTSYEARDARQFLSILDPANSAWGLSSETLYGNRWIFRGQADARWPLMPAAWRSVSKALLAKFVPSGMFDGVHYPKQWDTAFHSFTAVEHEIVRQFARLADEVGHPVPAASSIPNDSCVHDMMTNQGGIGCMEWWIPSAAIALAQHHGIPTRLLDFTANTTAAAFFAAQSAQKEKSAQHIAVWACDVHRFPSYVEEERGRNYPISCFQPLRSEIAFLHAQSGCFLFVPCALANEFFKAHKRWPSLAEAIAFHCEHTPMDVVTYQKLFLKIRLSVKEVPKVLDLLWRRRTSLAHLMPTYDNVKKTLFDFLRIP